MLEPAVNDWEVKMELQEPIIPDGYNCIFAHLLNTITAYAE